VSKEFAVVNEAAGVQATVEFGINLVKPGGTMFMIGFANKPYYQ